MPERRPWPAEPDTIAAAARLLGKGGLVAFPTETVYGLGADATADRAVARIYDAKGRPRFNPLIAHLADVAQAEALGCLDHDAAALAEAFWPGPLTLVVPARPGGVCDLARAGLDSVALRVPAHPVARALIREAGVPVAAPSANRSGRISPTTASHVADELGRVVDAILDGGPTQVGIESTIVACLGDVRLLRPGGVPRETIQRVLGRPLAAADAGGGIQAPGMLASHYAPRAGVRLAATAVAPGEAVLDFAGRLASDLPGFRLDLSPTGDLAEAAANLFGHLRRLDRCGAAVIAVAPIPPHGLGDAINDRLSRAAAPRTD